MLKRAWNRVWSAVMRVKDAVTAPWHAAEDRFPWVERVGRAWDRMSKRNGGQFAAAISYFVFLAIFPLLLLAVSIASFVLSKHPAALEDLLTTITNNIPGTVGNEIANSVETFIHNRTKVGLIGLIGLLFTGLGFVGNLRAAVEAMWGRTGIKHNYFLRHLSNLMVLIGLGLALLLSIGLTVVTSAATEQVLRALSLEDVGGVHYALKLIGTGVAVVGDILIFFWLLVVLPGVRVPLSVGLRGALLAAVGFEILKVVGTYTIAHTSQSLSAGPFASIIALLIWLQLVSRLILFSASWTAVYAADMSEGVEEVTTGGEIEQIAVQGKPQD